MEKYIDDNYILVDDTILMYSGEAERVRVPAMLGAVPVGKLGNGAFCNHKMLTDLYIEDGISEIGRECFSGAYRLRSVSIPGSVKMIGFSAFERPTIDRRDMKDLHTVEFREMRLPLEEFRRMYAAGIPAVDENGKHAVLFEGIPGGFPCEGLVGSFFDKPPARLPVGNTELFLRTEAQTTVTDGTDYLRFSLGNSGNRGLSEQEVIRNLCRSETERNESETAVRAHDNLLRTGKKSRLSRANLLAVDMDSVRESGGACIFNAYYYLVWVFFPVVIPIAFGGRRYCLYRRCYLNSRREIEYSFEDVGIFSEEGEPVTDQEVVESVYGKYMLASIL